MLKSRLGVDGHRVHEYDGDVPDLEYDEDLRGRRFDVQTGKWKLVDTDYFGEG